MQVPQIFLRALRARFGAGFGGQIFFRALRARFLGPFAVEGRYAANVCATIVAHTLRVCGYQVPTGSAILKPGGRRTRSQPRALGCKKLALPQWNRQRPQPPISGPA